MAAVSVADVAGAVRPSATAERDPERLGELEFFGEFLIQTEANLKALGDVYGFQVDETDAGLGVGEFLARQFPRPVVVCQGGATAVLRGSRAVLQHCYIALLQGPITRV